MPLNRPFKILNCVVLKYNLGSLNSPVNSCMIIILVDLTTYSMQVVRLVGLGLKGSQIPLF